MQYTIILTPQELDIISKILQEGPYKYVKPILSNIAQQVDTQNQPKEIKEDLNNKQD